jgi:2-iminobutanoate/2-iminopropanoate deaminase
MHAIEVPDAPQPGGHYAQAIVANGFVFVAGQLPLIPGAAPGTLPEGIRAQTRQAIANAEAILRGAGASLQAVVSATMYITDVALWPDVNAVFAECFGTHRPARAMVTSPTLHFGALVEMQCTAVVPA